MFGRLPTSQVLGRARRRLQNLFALLAMVALMVPSPKVWADGTELIMPHLPVSAASAVIEESTATAGVTLELVGPKRAVARQPARYTITLYNRGTKASSPISVVAALSKGLKPAIPSDETASASKPAYDFDKDRNLLRWQVEALSPDVPKTIVFHVQADQGTVAQIRVNAQTQMEAELAATFAPAQHMALAFPAQPESAESEEKANNTASDPEKMVAAASEPKDQGDTKPPAPLPDTSIPGRRSIKFNVSGPEEVANRRPFEINIQIVNDGDVPVQNGGMTLALSNGLKLEEVSPIARKPYNLQPGQSLRVPLSLRPTTTGAQGIKVAVEADGVQKQLKEAIMTVLGPTLKVQVDGPNTANRNRPLTYSLTIANLGTASAKGPIGFVELPRSWQYISSTHSGVYDPRQHLIYWRLKDLDAGMQQTVELNVTPGPMGRYELRGSTKDIDDNADESYLNPVISY